MDIHIVVDKMIQLFMMIGLGYFLGHTKDFKGDFVGLLNRFVLNVTMPCLIISSLSTGHNTLALSDLIKAIIILIFILPLFAYLCIKIFPIKNKALAMFMMIYPNVGFIGFPLMQSIFGEKAILSTAIINMPFNLSLFTLGVMIMNSQSSQKMNFKAILTPGVISSLISIILYIGHIQLPETLNNPITLIGNMTTPLAMIIIGATLSFYNIKDVLLDYKVYLFTFLIDIVIPVIFSPFVHMLIQNQMIQGMTLIILAMPVANGAVLFARNYQQDEFLAAKTVFISTILSILTIPLIISYVL